MLGFEEIAAVASAIGLLAFQPSATFISVDTRDRDLSAIAFTSTFQGVDGDGETLVWSSDAPESKTGFIMRLMPMSSAAGAAESVWPVRATLTTHDSIGAPMESTLYGIIDWSKQELRLHGSCDSGPKSGSSVIATGTFSHMDVAGTVNVLPLTASR
ncbi:MAG: hypothetical protein ABI889_04625 [Gemmatimonadota bacterium]